MKPTYSSGPEPKYPEYYILDIGDLVSELCDKWHEVIAAEVAPYHDAPQTVYPEVYTVNGNGSISKEVYLAQHHAIRKRPWHPDVSFILIHVIDAIKQRRDVLEDIEITMQLLEYDIAAMTHHHLQPNIPDAVFSTVFSDARMQIARLANRFGKQLFQRLMELGLYKNGYFPYHFAGWQDTCALVELDVFPFDQINHTQRVLEVDPPYEELYNGGST